MVILHLLVSLTNCTIIRYGYDASGNRISKIITTTTPAVSGDSTYYVRDASGNVMSVYNKKSTANLLQTELHLYGSSRLGVYNVAVDVQNCPYVLPAAITIFTRGNKFFELSNHLGNVLATITDKKVPHSTDGTTVDYYTADISNATDYYPFGMQMPGRNGHAVSSGGGNPGGSSGSTAAADLIVNNRVGNTPGVYEATNSIIFDIGFSSSTGDVFEAHILPVIIGGSSGGAGTWAGGTSGSYRYGFNGKENDNEVKGEGNAYDFGARIYDPRLGRWLAVDQMRKASPGETPYRFGHNNPLEFRDPDGKWEEDGHFWTVYAMGIALGLNKIDARGLAVKAEFYDHIVHTDNSMSIQPIPGKGWMSWGKDGGIGTWADPVDQKTMHGLTGGSQSELLSSVIANIIGSDLYQLHTLGDAWAHSYIDDKGNRGLYGQHGRNEPWYAGIVRAVLGDISFEHAKAGPKSGEIADNISDRPVEYEGYIQSLLGIFNSKFHDKLKANSRIDIFDYVQKNGGSKDANIFLLSSYIDLQTGTKSFSTDDKSYNKKLSGYLDKMGIKYTNSTSTSTSTISNGSGNVPITTTITHYKTKIN